MASDASTGAGPGRGTQDRPLSPHLQIYRWEWTMALSIVHRATGLALVVGTLLLVYWLVAAVAGPAAFDTAQRLIGHWAGRLLLLGWSFSLFYHLANGLRHMFWDAGKGFGLTAAFVSGMVVVLVSLGLTLLCWLIGYGLVTV